MIGTPPRLREVAALSWTAARLPRGNPEQSIAALRKAIELTRRWLVEVESEIVSHIETSEAKRSSSSGESHGKSSTESSTESSTKRSTKSSMKSRTESTSSSCEYCQKANVESTHTRLCSMLSCYKAYAAVKFTTEHPKELVLLCLQHGDLSACVADGQAEMSRLEGIVESSRRRVHRRPIDNANSGEDTKRSSTRSTESNRRSATNNSEAALGHIKTAESVSSASQAHGNAKRCSRVPVSSSRPAGHVSPQSILSVENVSDNGKGKASSSRRQHKESKASVSDPTPKLSRASVVRSVESAGLMQWWHGTMVGHRFDNVASRLKASSIKDPA